MSNEDDKTRITLRMPKDIRDKVSEAAEVSGRTMNGEIVFRLAQSFEQESRSEQVFFSRAAPPDIDEEPISEEEAETLIQSMVRAVRNMTKK